LDPKFDSARAVQIRLPAFNYARLVEVGTRVRDIYADGQDSAERLHRLADDAFVADFATEITGDLGGNVGIAPRIFLKKLVSEVLDRVDEFPDFDARRDGTTPINDSELSLEEREARTPRAADDIALDV
jgi:hypothetical protein